MSTYDPQYRVPDLSQPRIGEWLSESFTLFGREWAVWVGQGAVFLFLGFAPLILGVLIYAGTLISLFMALFSNRPVPTSSGPPMAMLAGLFAVLVGMFASLFLAAYLVAGMERTAAKQLRGEPISVRDIFSGGDVYLPALLASIISALALTCGSSLFVLPGFLLGGLLSFAYPIITEQRVGVMEALRRSWQATVPHMWLYLLWFFLLYVVQIVGGAFVIGYVITMPIYAIALMVAYRDVFGLPGADGPAPVVPVVPADAAAPVFRCPACERQVAAGAVMCPHCHASIPSGYTG